MKKSFLAIFAVTVFLTNSAFAAPQDVDPTTPQGSCEVAAAPSLEEIEVASQSQNEDGEWARGSWHCTAYPEGHGHHDGYSYSDVHYSHAYRGAMRRCERATHHHCHDVHCHYDHH